MSTGIRALPGEMRRLRKHGLQLSGIRVSSLVPTRCGHAFPGSRILYLLIAFAFASQTASSQTEEDLASITRIESDWQNAWNRHDAGALSALVSIDVDFVLASGRWLQGRSEFDSYHVRIFNQQFKESKWTRSDLRIKFLKPDVAMVHVRWTISRITDAHGRLQGMRTGISERIELKKGGHWLIRESQNTYDAEPKRQGEI